MAWIRARTLSIRANVGSALGLDLTLLFGFDLFLLTRYAFFGLVFCILR